MFPPRALLAVTLHLPVDGAPGGAPPTGECLEAVDDATTHRLFDGLVKASPGDGCVLENVATETSQVRIEWKKAGKVEPAILVVPTSCLHAPTTRRKLSAIVPPDLVRECPQAIDDTLAVVDAQEPKIKLVQVEAETARIHPERRWHQLVRTLVGTFALAAAGVAALLLVRRRRRNTRALTDGGAPVQSVAHRDVEGAPGEPRRDSRAVGAIVVALITLAAYQPVLTARGPSFEFLSIDDQSYIVENTRVTTGLTRENVGWALTSLHQSNWHPLTWMSWQLDAQLYGIHPWGFHLTNVLLHIANGALLFLALQRLTAAWGRSLVVAALFAVHPLHVESVVWVSERKDVLSTLFCFLSIGIYTSYGRRPTCLRYAAVTGLFALALASKSMLVTLPAVLLLFDVWPLRRLDPPRPVGLARIFGEKLPWVALAVATAVVTVRAQQRMIAAIPPLPVSARVENALVYYVTYVARTLWPWKLTVYHPNPGVALPWPHVIEAGVLLAIITAIAVSRFRTRPYLIVGWCLFVGTLVPVIGLVQVGFLATADHYTYVPVVGLFVMVVWSVHDVLASTSASPAVGRAMAGAVLVACVVLSRLQLAHWQTSETLWEYVTQVSPAEAMPHAFLGVALDRAGRRNEADRQLALACELDPSWRTHLADGLAFEHRGDTAAAQREFETVLLVAPHNLTAVDHLATAFKERGDVGAALRQFTTLARLRPTDAGPEYDLGLLYERDRDVEQARRHWIRALELDPTLEGARERLESTAPKSSP